jgi:hypothetical protein
MLYERGVLLLYSIFTVLKGEQEEGGKEMGPVPTKGF